MTDLNTIKFEVLHPQEVPKTITARAVSEKLADHFLMFINANNLNGYLKDKDRVINESTISGILLIVAGSDGLHDLEYRNFAYKIRDLSARAISVCQAYEMLAKALGYRTHLLSHLCRSEIGYRVNVWNGYENAHDSIFDLGTFYLNAKNPKIQELLTKYRTMNLKNENKTKIKQLRRQ